VAWERCERWGELALPSQFFDAFLMALVTAAQFSVTYFSVLHLSRGS
jgi:hypothetical protein